MYSTKDPGEIQAVQLVLLGIQKQDDGQLARQLLQLESKNCQYFGALTYSVFINNHKGLDKDSLDVVINDLVSFITCQKFDGMIVRKLLSNYSLLFINNYETFTNPVARLFGGSLGDVNSLNEVSFLVLINFCEILVEELIKKEQLVQLHEVVYDQIFPHVSSIFHHLHSLDITSGIPFQILSESLNCLNSWITYISMAETQSKIRYTDTEVITDYLFCFLERLPFDEQSMILINKCMSSITEILETNPTMLSSFNKKQYLKSLLFEESKFGDRFVNGVIFNEDNFEMYEDEAGNFINLIIVFLLRDMLSFTKNIIDPVNRYILSTLVKLTNFPGIPKSDESISEQMLSFWEEFFNVFMDDEETIETFYSSEANVGSKQEFYALRDQSCNEVCLVYWNKIKLPSPDILKGNESEFFYFKANVGDFFSTVYSLLKLPFYESLTQLAVDFLRSKLSSLCDLEAILYILYKINEDSTFYESQSVLLLPFADRMMSNGLLDIFRGLSADMPNYYHVASTIIRFIASIEFYFKAEGNGPQYLGSILDFLFNVIIHSNDPKLSLLSSKTILSVCQECRAHMVVFLPNLKVLLTEMILNNKIDNLIRTRMANSYISIVQSAYLKDPKSFSASLGEILSLIDSLSNALMSKQLDEDSEDYLVSLLSCVNEVGKATILPDELDELYTEQESWEVSEFWQNDSTNLKQIILSIIEKFSITYEPFKYKSAVTEICCHILKCGLNEPINGPFKFELHTIFNYLATKVQNCDPSSIYHVFKLIECIVITNYKSVDESTLSEVLNNIVVPFFRNSNTDDPDIISSSIDIFTSILDKKPSLLLDLNIELFKEVLQYALTILNSTDILTIKSLMKFWNSFIVCKKGTQSDQVKAQQIVVDENFGQALLNSLITSFTNNSRSNLDYYYPVFRALISKYQLHCKTWMMLYLSNTNLKNTNDQEKKRFMDKLFLTRGQRLANDVLKGFWLQVNGLIEFNSKKY